MKGILLIALPLVVFLPGYWLNGFITAHDTSAAYPLKVLAFDAIKRADFPSWGPLYTGSPLVGQLGTVAFFHPFSISFLVFPYQFAQAFSFMLAVSLSGLFFYIWIQRSFPTVDVAGIWIAAMVYMFCGYVTVNMHRGHSGELYTYPFIPLLLLSTDKVVVGAKRFIAVGAIAFGCMLLSGYPQSTANAMFIVGPYFLFSLRSSRTVPLPNGIRSSANAVAAFVALLALGASLAAILLLPTMHFQSLDWRHGAYVNREYMLGISVPPVQLLTLIFPHLWGMHDDTWSAQLISDFFLQESVLYFGIIPLLLVGVAIVKGWGDKKLPIRFFAISAVVVALLMMGRHMYLYNLLYYLPIYRNFRGPARFVFDVPIIASVLTAFGLHYLRCDFLQEGKKGFRYRHALYSISMLALLVGAMLWILPVESWEAAEVSQTIVSKLPRGRGLADHWIRTTWPQITLYLRRDLFAAGLLLSGFAVVLRIFCHSNSRMRAWRWVVVGIGLLVLVDLLWYGLPMVYDTDNIREYLSQNEAIAYIKRVESHSKLFEFRVMSPSKSFEYATNASFMYGLQDIQTYASLQLTYWKEFAYIMDGKPLPLDARASLYFHSPDSPLLNMLNVKYIIAESDHGFKWVETLSDALHAGRFTWVYRGEKLNVFRNDDYLPRAWDVYRYEVLDDEQIIERLRDPAFDPTRVVLLEREPQVQFPLLGSEQEAYIRITSYENDRIRLEVDFPQNGILFLSEVYHPFWHAYVDGSETEVLKADWTFRAIVVPQGRHEVVLEYEDWPFRAGAVISSLSLLCVLAIWIRNKNGRATTS